MANDGKETLETIKEDTKDLVNEARHRAKAAIDKTQADVDRAKREARHAADDRDDKV